MKKNTSLLKSFFAKFKKNKNNIDIGRPYLISVANDSDEIKIFELFGAYQYIPQFQTFCDNKCVHKEGFCYQSLVINGVTISTYSSEFTYKQLLYMSMNIPFKFKSTFLKPLSKLIGLSLIYNTTDANGKIFKKLLTIEEFATETGFLNHQYPIDGFTKLVGTIQPKSKIEFEFYTN